MIKAVIFDLDGVLCSTDIFHYKAWKELADNLGIEIPIDLADKIRGISRLDSLDIVLGDKKDSFSADEKNRLADEKNEMYKAMLSTMTEDDRSPGATEVLIYLKGKKLKTAIGSSSKNTRLILSHLKLLDVFDVIIDGTMITKSKPDPEVFLKAAEALDCNPSSCIVIEDAYMGIEAAVRGGFIPIAIGKDAARHNGALFQINSLLELRKIIDQDT